MKTGELIRKYRKEKKLTMKELGKKIGVSEQAISQYERGVRNVNLETLIKLSDALNVTINNLTNENQLSPIQLLLKKEVLEKGLTFKELSEQTGVPENEIQNMYTCDNVTKMGSYFDLFRFFGVDDKTIMDNIILHYKLDSIYNNNGSDPMKMRFRNMFLSEPLSAEESSIGIEKMDNSDLFDYIAAEIDSSSLQGSQSINNLECLVEDLLLPEKINALIPKIKLLSPILESYGLEFTIIKENNNTFVNIDNSKGNFSKSIHLDDFLHFIEKVYWGIEREIDYLKHLYD